MDEQAPTQEPSTPAAPTGAPSGAAPAASTGAAAPIPAAVPDGSWRDTLPDTIRDNPSLVDTKTVGDLAQRFLDTKQMVGNSLRMPTDDAGVDSVKAFTDKILANEKLGLMRRPDPTSDEAMGAVYDSLGRPDDAEGYAAVEGADLNTFKGLSEVAHKLGLSKKQFEDLATAQVAMHQEQAAGFKAEQDAATQEVRAEWGLAFDEKVGRATTMLELTKAPQALIDAMAKGDVGADVMRWVDSIATKLGSEGAPMARDLTPVTAETTEQLRQSRDDITQRMIKENLSVAQKQDLQAKLLRVSERIMKAEGRE